MTPFAKSQASLVARWTIAAIMSLAVNLDRQQSQRAIEIEHIRSGRMLPSKL
jgi:hypothetical protein